jgi:tRNA(fMet)-specific endonuclease VapC
LKQYLLDTNICIHRLNGKFGLEEKLDEVDRGNCFISEITLAELKFGVENSVHQAINQKALDIFLSEFKILPIFNSIDFFAIEKARLRKLGTPIPDFDLLIASTAVTQNLIMVTNNTNHFQRIRGIRIEDWTK